MSMARPHLLWLMLLIVPELLLFARRFPRLSATMSALAGPTRRARVRRRYSLAARLGLFSSAIFIVSASLALSGPSWGMRAVKTERSGMEIAIVLDVSRSMLSSDETTGGASRLELARELVASLLREMPGASFSLALAKGDGVTVVPMTRDTEALEGALAYAVPEAMTSPGTDLGAGIDAGLSTFPERSMAARLMVLFSDGGDRGGKALSRASEAGRRGIPILAIAVGGDAPSAIPGPLGDPLVDSRGQPRRQALEGALLRSIAAASHGRYAEAGESHGSLLSPAERQRLRSEGVTIEYRSRDRSGFFLLLSLLSFMGRMAARWMALSGWEARRFSRSLAGLIPLIRSGRGRSP